MGSRGDGIEMAEYNIRSFSATAGPNILFLRRACHTIAGSAANTYISNFRFIIIMNYVWNRRVPVNFFGVYKRSRNINAANILRTCTHARKTFIEFPNVRFAGVSVVRVFSVRPGYSFIIDYFAFSRRSRTLHIDRMYPCNTYVR